MKQQSDPYRHKKTNYPATRQEKVFNKMWRDGSMNAPLVQAVQDGAFVPAVSAQRIRDKVLAGEMPDEQDVKDFNYMFERKPTTRAKVEKFLFGEGLSADADPTASDYCLKCKQHTENVNTQMTQTANGRHMRKSNCAVCNTKKCRFVKAGAEGEGFLTDLALKGTRKVFGADKGITFPGERHLPWGPYNWAGPGTNIKERLKLMKSGKSLPINGIDRAAYTHDLEYAYARQLLDENKIDKAQLKKMIAKADADFVRRVQASKDNSFLSKTLVSGTFNAKSILDKIRENPSFVYGSTANDPTDEQWRELGFEIEG